MIQVKIQSLKCQINLKHIFFTSSCERAYSRLYKIKYMIKIKFRDRNLLLLFLLRILRLLKTIFIIYSISSDKHVDIVFRKNQREIYYLVREFNPFCFTLKNENKFEKMKKKQSQHHT